MLLKDMKTWLMLLIKREVTSKGSCDYNVTSVSFHLSKTEKFC